jgi:hypothetical protein
MVSLGLVGEVFEVRTQVDRDLTTVSRVDRRLRLIKNLGRHIYGNLSNFEKKYIFIPTASQIALRNPPRVLKECQKDTTYIEATQTLSKINSSPTTASTF